MSDTPMTDRSETVSDRIGIELQRVWCFTCQRHGRYLFHWHRHHSIGSPKGTPKDE